MDLNRTGFPGGPDFWKDGAMTTNKTSKPYPAELRERAVRLVREHEAEHASLAAAIRSVAAKVGCSAETLRLWVRRSEYDTGRQGGPNVDERERIRALEREVRELRQANEILRKASAYFAQAELDRRSKP
jgi:transposase